MLTMRELLGHGADEAPTQHGRARARHLRVRRHEAEAPPAAPPAPRCEETDRRGRRCGEPPGHLLPHVITGADGEQLHAWPARGRDDALVRVEEDGGLTLIAGARVRHDGDCLRVDYPEGSPWGGAFVAHRGSTHSCAAFGTRSTWREILVAAARQGIPVS